MGKIGVFAEYGSAAAYPCLEHSKSHRQGHIRKGEYRYRILTYFGPIRTVVQTMACPRNKRPSFLVPIGVRRNAPE